MVKIWQLTPHGFLEGRPSKIKDDIDSTSSPNLTYFGLNFSKLMKPFSKIQKIDDSFFEMVVQKKKLSGLTLSQLKEYGLETLLDQSSDNETILLASEDVWQIAAFGDLYAEKIAKSLPKKADYERAKRLYQACLASGVDNGYFEKKIADLERVWKKKTE